MPIANINAELRGGLGFTDKQNAEALRKALGEIFSRKNLGLNVRTFTSNITLDVSDALALCDPSGGTFTVTLQPANTWSSRDVKKTPFIAFQNTHASTAVTIAAAAGETIEGSATYTLSAGFTLLLVSDGNTAWYLLGDAVSHPTVSVLTSGTTFTWPAGVDEAYVIIIGGGAGGGSGNVAVAANESGGGGGGVGETISFYYPRNGNTTTTYAIGTKGSGGAGVVGVNGIAGGAGGNTTWGTSEFIAKGGAAGDKGISGTSGFGGNGGSWNFPIAGGAAVVGAGNGLIGTTQSLWAGVVTAATGAGGGSGAQGSNQTGGGGGNSVGRTAPTSVTTAANVAGGGSGGNSSYGGGGAGGGNAVNNGANATGFGAGGGGGAGKIAGTSGAGGNGSDGVIILIY